MSPVAQARLRVLAVVIRCSGGGAERAVQLLREPLEHLGVETRTVAIDPALPGEPVDPSSWLTRRRLPGPLRIVVAAARLRRLLRTYPPSVLHLHCEAPELVGLLAVRCPRRLPGAVVVSEHTSSPWASHRRLGGLVRWGLRSMGATFVSCFEPFEPFEPQGCGTVIANPLQPVRATGTGAPQVVCVARLIASKRIDRVVDALVGVPGLALKVIGRGPQEDALRRRAAQQQVAVTWAGYVLEPWSQISANDVFVSASEVEGEPLSVLEAVSASVPLLLNDIPAHRRLMPGHPGLFAADAELREHLLAIAQDSVAAERFRVTGQQRQMLLDDRIPAVVASRWAVLYDDLLIGKDPW